MSFLCKMNIRLACGRDSLKIHQKSFLSNYLLFPEPIWTRSIAKSLSIPWKRVDIFSHTRKSRGSPISIACQMAHARVLDVPLDFLRSSSAVVQSVLLQAKPFKLGTVFGWASSGTRELLPLPKYLDSFSGDKYLITFWKKRTRKKNLKKKLKSSRAKCALLLRDMKGNTGKGALFLTQLCRNLHVEQLILVLSWTTGILQSQQTN